MKSTLLIFLASILLTKVSGQDPWKNVYAESAWGERDKWQKADELIGLLSIKKGNFVADVGCNEGYVSVKLAAVVGSNGKVYAVDVNQSKLNMLADHLKERKITNVTLVKGDYDNPKLPVDGLDAVIILDTYHEMDDHDDILRHIKSSLRPGGRLVICEPIAEDRRDLSRDEQERKHELSINFALDDLSIAGFEVVYTKDPFIDRTKVKGDLMWVIVAKKNEAK